MHALLVAGLGFGDEGKGTIVDSLVRETGAKWVVRYNGGAQAAHHVVTDDGITHCFSQFGAGTLAGANTYLSRFMTVEPIGFMREEAALRGSGATPTVLVDGDALVATPYHRRLNQAQELARGASRHGSCGLGMGETRRLSIAYPDMAVRVRDLPDKITLHRKLQWLRDYLREHRVDFLPKLSWLNAYDAFLARVQILKENPIGQFTGTVVFEGAQGVLLDETYGFHPHTTWSNTTFDNAHTLLSEAFARYADVTRIGVTRCYQTRHGAGPFPFEDDGIYAPGDHNTDSPWQGRLRQGPFDAVLVDYAIQVLSRQGVQLDGLAVTWLDTLQDSLRWKAVANYQSFGHPHPLHQHGLLLRCSSAPTLAEQESLGTYLTTQVSAGYQEGTNGPIDFTPWLEQAVGVPVIIESFGPTASGKHYSPATDGFRRAMLPAQCGSPS